MIYDLQKASLWKRIAAFLLDAILIVIVATGVLALLSWALGYDGYLDTYTARMQAIEAEYGLIDAGILGKDAYLTDLVGTQAYQDLSQENKEIYDQAVKAFLADEEASAAYNMMTSLLMIFITIPVLVGYLVVEFAVPLFLKNGQTLGKKVFGIALVRVDCVKVTPLQLFVRALLGKYTIETMAVAFLIVLFLSGMTGWIGLAAILGVLVLEIVVICKTKNNSLIHDLLAGTVAVDLASQKIFESPEELLEYKKKLQAEAAAESKYF